MYHSMTAEVNETCEDISLSKACHDFMVIVSMYQYCGKELYIGSHMKGNAWIFTVFLVCLQALVDTAYMKEMSMRNFI